MAWPLHALTVLILSIQTNTASFHAFLLSFRFFTTLSRPNIKSLRFYRFTCSKTFNKLINQNMSETRDEKFGKSYRRVMNKITEHHFLLWPTRALRDGRIDECFLREHRRLATILITSWLEYLNNVTKIQGLTLASLLVVKSTKPKPRNFDEPASFFGNRTDLICP